MSTTASAACDCPREGEPWPTAQVAPHVRESWERCQRYGLDPHGLPRRVLLSAPELARRRKEKEIFLSAAQTFLANLCSVLDRQHFRFAIADADGYKLDCFTTGSPESVRPAGDEPPDLGQRWSEDVCGTTAVGLALVLGAPVLLRREEHFFHCLRHGNSAAVPVRDGAGCVLGVLNLCGPEEEVTEFSHRMLIVTAQEIEREIRLVLTSRRLEAQNRRLELLNDLERLLTEWTAESRICGEVVACLRTLDPRRTVALLRYDFPTQTLVTEAAHPADPTRVPRWWPIAGHDALARALRTERPVLLTGDMVPPECDLGGRRPEGLLAVPILAGTEAVGILLVAGYEPDSLSPEDVQLYGTVAARLGAFVTRARLHRDLVTESNLRRAILEQVDAGLVIIDLDAGRLIWNRAMACYFDPGRRCAHQDGSLPRPDKVMRYPVRFAEGDVGDLLQRVIATAQPVASEATVFCDPPRTFRVTTGPVPSSGGTVRWLIQTYADITPYRCLEQRKSDLVAMISHELRTPLTGIKGYARLLSDYCPEEGPCCRLTEGLRRETDALAALVERVVAVNRLELGEPLRVGPVVLRPVLEKAIARLAPQAREKQVRVTLEGPDLKVHGDPDALHLVFSNLLDNAIKYSPPESEVPVRLGHGEGKVLVEVSDEGPGIPPEHHEEIFQRFYRVASPEAVSLPGSGLGLYIVRRLVEQHGGEVRIRSGVGRGTTLVVSLPEEVEVGGEAHDPDR